MITSTPDNPPHHSRNNHWRAGCSETGTSGSAGGRAEKDPPTRAPRRAADPAADLIDGPLAHLPSGRFAANGAWLLCATIAHNLLRAAGTLTSRKHARARGTTLRHQIVNIAARLAHHAHGIDLHLPAHRPWATRRQLLFDTTHRPAPAPAAPT